jgi:hypothetical protein
MILKKFSFGTGNTFVELSIDHEGMARLLVEQNEDWCTETNPIPVQEMLESLEELIANARKHFPTEE